MTDENTRTAIAQSHFDIHVDCPYCDNWQDVTDDLQEYLDENELRADECSAEVTCEKCKKEFIVTKVEY